MKIDDISIQRNSFPHSLLLDAVLKINKILENEIENIFIFISCNICFGCSKEQSH